MQGFPELIALQIAARLK